MCYVEVKVTPESPHLPTQCTQEKLLLMGGAILETIWKLLDTDLAHKLHRLRFEFDISTDEKVLLCLRFLFFSLAFYNAEIEEIDTAADIVISETLFRGKMTTTFAQNSQLDLARYDMDNH